MRLHATHHLAQFTFVLLPMMLLFPFGNGAFADTPGNNRLLGGNSFSPASGWGGHPTFFDCQQQNGGGEQKTADFFDENVRKCGNASQKAAQQRQNSRTPSARTANLRKAEKKPTTNENGKGIQAATKLPSAPVDHDRMIAAINDKLSYLRQQPSNATTAAKIATLENALTKVMAEKECK